MSAVLWRSDVTLEIAPTHLISLGFHPNTWPTRTNKCKWWTKWSTFCRQHFEVYFLDRKEIFIFWSQINKFWIIQWTKVFVQVMAWCHQATSHYLNQCYQRTMMACGVTRLQWVNSLWVTNETRLSIYIVHCKIKLKHDMMKLCIWLQLSSSKRAKYHPAQYWYIYNIIYDICKTLIHCGLVTPYGDIDLGQHGLR